MKHLRLGLVMLIATTLAGCNMGTPTTTLSAGQAALSTPEAALNALKAGNERFNQGHPLHPHESIERRTEVAAAQHPIAIIVGCSDSRVPPEIVFDQGLGDLFVVRVAGNVVDDQALGSIEYAVEHLHVKLIVVLGQDKCEAVEAAVNGGQVLGHMQSIVDAIKPAVELAKTEPGNLLDNAIDENARNVAGQLWRSEPILYHAIESGQLHVEAARYKLDSGKVLFLGLRAYNAGSQSN
jgi:carbonic anhydrase